MKYDPSLVKEAIRGDKKALNKLIEKSYKSIFYYALKKFNSEAEDIAHKAVISIMTSISTLKDPKKFESWMLGTVSNVCGKEMRRKYLKNKIFTDMEDSEFTASLMETESLEFLPEEYVINSEKREIVLNAIKSLPAQSQDIMLFFYFEGMSYSEIAQTLDINEHAVKNALYRGKSKLKELLEQKEGKHFTMYSVAPMALSMLSRVFQADAESILTPEACARVLQKAHDVIAQLDVVPKSAASTAKTGTAIKSVVGGIVTLAVLGGIILLVPKEKEAPTELHPPVISETVSSSKPTQSPPFIIETLADMIGEDEAAQLMAYINESVDLERWNKFLLHIGAEYDMNALEYDYEYTMYLLYKQDKMLVLAERRRLSDDALDIRYQFGEKREAPYTADLIFMFDS